MSRINTYFDPRTQIIKCTECGLSLDLCQCEDISLLAHTRLWSAEGVVVKRIMDQLGADRQMKPDNQYNLVYLQRAQGVLAEKMIAISQGINCSPQEVLEASIRVALLAIRIAVEGDGDFSYHPESILTPPN